jgi:hypothetical protein
LVFDVGWFKIAITVLVLYWGVQGCVAPEGWRTERGSGVIVGVWAHNSGESLLRWQGKGGVALSDRYVLWGAREGDVWLWMCQIILGMLGLNEGEKDAVGWFLLKAYLKLLIFLTYLFRGTRQFKISKCALQRTHEETLFTPGRNTPFEACYYCCCFCCQARNARNRIIVIFVIIIVAIIRVCY